MGKVAANAAAAEARRLLGEAGQRGLKLRLLGGVAVLLHCHSEAAMEVLGREYVDLDFAGLSKEVPALTRFFIDAGYEPHKRFNAVMGEERLLFSGDGTVDHLDIILDKFHMCHTWDLRPRLGADPQTLPLADLLLTKLQVVELTEKDIKDTGLLVLHHGLGPGDQDQINTAYLASRLGDDWGLWRTVTGNLTKALDHLSGLSFAERGLVVERLAALRALADQAPKTLRWKARAAVGEKMKWYELPGDVRR
jgi:hypothetical protein